MCLVLKGSSAELLGNKDLRGWRRAAPAGQGLTTGSQSGLYFHRDLLQTSQSWGELCPVGSCKCLPAPQRDGGEEPCAGLRRPRLSLKWGQSPPPPPGWAALCLSGLRAQQTRVSCLPSLFVLLSGPGRSPSGRQPLGSPLNICGCKTWRCLGEMLQEGSTLRATCLHDLLAKTPGKLAKFTEHDCVHELHKRQANWTLRSGHSHQEIHLYLLNTDLALQGTGALCRPIPTTLRQGVC